MSKKETTKFEQAYSLNVNDKAESKNGLTYISWAWAWAEFKKIYPDASYEVQRYGENSLPYVADTTGYMVATKVTANNETHEMWLPVMNYKNKAMKQGEATMFDVNKAIMRCLTKNLAMFGLGLYIYAGEDLPEINEDQYKAEIDAIKTVEEGREYYKQSRGRGAEHDKYLQAHIDKLKAE